MRDHSECEQAIHDALVRGKDGLAEFLATRCDRTHGDQSATTTEPEEG